MSTDAFDIPIELDRRSGDGIEVALLWSRASGRVWIALEDTRNDVSLEVEVRPDEAGDAFRHPYAYVERAEADRPRLAQAA